MSFTVIHYIDMAKVTYSFKIDPELLERLQKESKLRDRSVGYLLRAYAKDKLDIV